MAAEPITTLRGEDLAQAVIRGAPVDDERKYDLVFLIVEGRLVAQVWDSAHQVSAERAVDVAVAAGNETVQFIS